MHRCCIIAVYLLFLPPPSLPIAPETANNTAVYDDIADDQTPSAELPGKQNPLDHKISPIPFSLMLALELPPLLLFPIAPILMHSLLLSPAIDTSPAILLRLVRNDMSHLWPFTLVRMPCLLPGHDHSR